MKQISSLLAVLLLASCNIINPSESEPAYLTINNITLQANSSEGGNTHNIKDAWVYVNSQLVGIYQMPATFPVLEEGEQVVEVFAGIKVNGITDYPDAYTFYERDSIIVDLLLGE